MEVRRIQKTVTKSADNRIVWIWIFVLIILVISTFMVILIARNKERTQQSLSNSPLPESPSIFHVRRVVDGDTIKVIGRDNIEFTVRLAEIDAPEIGQLFGNISKMELSKYILDKDVVLKDIKTGKYGRYVANIYCEGEWINHKLVKNGMAWAYKETSSNSIDEAEIYSREMGLGLWGNENPISPWEWRKQEK